MIKQPLKTHGGGLASAFSFIVWAALCVGAFLTLRSDFAIAGVAATGALVVLALPFVRPHRSSFGLVVLGLVGGLVALELGIRLMYFGADGVLRFTQYSPHELGASTDFIRPLDSELVYGLNPNLHARSMSQDLVTNRQGFRGPDFVEARAPGVPRILVAGSSVTMGAGVKVEDAYPSVVARLLSEKRKAPVEVLNFGIPAYPEPLHFALASRMARIYHPDFVVVELGRFHADPVVAPAALVRQRQEQPRVSTVELLSFAASGLYPPANLRQRIEGFWPFGRHRATGGEAPAADYLTDIEKRIRALTEQGRAQGFKVVIILIRPLHTLTDPSFLSAERAGIRKAAESSGAIVADTFPMFSASDLADALIVFPGDLHGNAITHERFARALAGAIESSGTAL